VTATLRSLGICVVFAALALGCGGEEKTQTAPAPDTQAQPAAPQPEAAAEAWQSTLPADFPPDLPQYPGATVTKARSTPGTGLAVAWQTGDEPAKVASWYADSLAAQGWATQRTEAPDGVMVFADKGERSATFGVTTAEGKTQIDLLVVEMR
jgi:hypothetical protein